MTRLPSIRESWQADVRMQVRRADHRRNERAERPTDRLYRRFARFTQGIVPHNVPCEGMAEYVYTFICPELAASLTRHQSPVAVPDLGRA